MHNQQRRPWHPNNGNDDRHQNNNKEWSVPPPGQGLLGMAPPNFPPMSNQSPMQFNNFRGNMNRGGYNKRGGGKPYHRGAGRGRGFRGSPHRGGFRGNNNFRGDW